MTTNQMPERIYGDADGNWWTNRVAVAHNLTEYTRADLAQKTVTMDDVMCIALESGFMLSTQYGQSDGKLMPVSDTDTLLRFAKALISAGVVKVKE